MTVPVDRLSAVFAGRHAIQTASRFNAKGSGHGGKEQHTYLTARPPFRSIGGYLPLLRERFGPSSGDRPTWGSARPSRSSPAWCRSGPARRSPGRPCWLRGRSGRPLPVKRDNNPVQTAALKRLVEPFIDATFSSMRLQLLPASRRGFALTEGNAARQGPGVSGGRAIRAHSGGRVGHRLPRTVSVPWKPIRLVSDSRPPLRRFNTGPATGHRARIFVAPA